MTPSSASKRSERDVAAIDAAGKRDLYALAARIFAAEVDELLLQRLESSGLAGAGHPAGLVLLEDEIRALDVPSAIEELAAEYCRLFVGPMPVCSPYASTQRGEALLGGRAGARLLEFLERHGLELTGCAEMHIASPDHVAVMLAVLAALYAESAAAPDEATAAVASSAARELLEQSVLPWVPSYLAGVATNARREPYASVSRLLVALLDEEREELAR
jgi:TorA maturation chaperone TorD